MEGQETGKVAIVTGSTRGIGRAVASALVARGDRVVVSGRNQGDADAVAAELTKAGPGRAIGVACDVRDPDACSALVDRTLSQFGKLEILINNAGIGRFAPIQEMTREDWDVQIRTNLDGVFYCSHAAIPHLIDAGEGWILNVASLAGRHTFPGGAAYNASKFGLVAMTDVMMLDLRHDGIRVSCILPGSVSTEFHDRDPGADDWRLAPEDVAQVVTEVLAYPARALPSRIEIRPSQPPKSK